MVKRPQPDHGPHAANGTARARVHHRGEGPKSLSDICELPLKNVDAILTAAARHGDSSVGDEMEQFCRRGLITSSCYSGTGALEIAAGLVRRRCTELFPRLPPPTVTCYSVTEINPDARLFLQSHHESTRAQHMCGDIIDRLSSSTQQRLRAIEAQALTLWRSTRAEFRDGQLDDRDVRVWRDKLTAEYLRDLLAEFQNIEFEETSWCYVHERRCPVSPRLGLNHGGTALWLEGAGSTCVPWSAMGARSKWLDEATLTFFTWLVAVRFYQPDLWLHE